MHVSITFGLLTLNPLDISGLPLLVFSFAVAAALWLVVAVIAVMHPEAISTSEALLNESRFAAASGPIPH